MSISKVTQNYLPTTSQADQVIDGEQEGPALIL